MFKQAARATKRLSYEFLLAPRGYGKPVPRTTWESQYKQGDWDFLYSIDEIAHYMVIVGLIRYIHTLPAILDVGCGHGRLLELLSAFGFESYVGIDLSSEAIKKAKSLAMRNARFEVADFEAWEAPERFDIIVFNESLYYAKRPVDILLRYRCSLHENGLMIVSMCQYGHQEAIWKNLEKYFAVINSTRVENHKKQIWDIKVIRQRLV